jgi:formylglycine-generating enzyme required for sulfatase activity
MHRSVAWFVLLCAVFTLGPRSAAAITISTVPVGNAGNAPDQDYGFGQLGAVAYAYRIGTTEVTNAQYAAFLNAKAKSDPLNLYSMSMGSGLGGIARSGASNNYTYAPIAGRADMPVNYVSWYDAIRFINWLENGQGDGDTETGSYTLGDNLDAGGTPIDGTTITRNEGATWFLPTQDEWYKAAYHQNDGVTGNYFLYPTASDSAPTIVPPPGGSNSANYANAVFDFTAVGAYVDSASPYGTFDQAGNVQEWNETLFDQFSLRGRRGGQYNGTVSMLRASSEQFKASPAFEDYPIGFRVAMVPEPDAAVLAIVAWAIAWRFRKRFR